MLAKRNLLAILLVFAVTSAFPDGFSHIRLFLEKNPFNVSNAEEKWMEQPMDHFDPNEKRTYKMRYFENLELWKSNAPIYIFIGGEAKLDPWFAENDERYIMAQLARETNGAMFATEHRYYGKSLPDIPKDDLVKYYKFLSSQEALADLVNFIKALKKDSKYASSKVVVVSGSYPGNLATWMRMLHPDLVDAALAMSAPVLAKTDFNGYLDVVRYTFGTYGTEGCLEKIENTFKSYEDLLKSAEGIETLKEKLGICPDSDLTKLENKQLLFLMLYYPLKLTSQQGPPSAVKNECNKYASGNLTLDYLDVFNQSTSMSYPGCTNIDFTAPLWTDPWSYQSCREFGYMQSTLSEKQPFVHWNPVEFLLKASCAGFLKGDMRKKVDKAVAKTNKMYGGLNPSVTKVVFTHGDMDPWHGLGILHDLSPDAPVFMVKGSSHCGIVCVTDEEPREMNEVRTKVKDLIKKWISTPLSIVDTYRSILT